MIATGPQKQAALHCSVEWGAQRAMGALLLDPRLRLDVVDKAGRTALQCARQQKAEALVAALQSAEHARSK